MSSINSAQSSSSNEKYSELTPKLQLHIYNKLIQQKVLFMPKHGNQVLWYSHEPTVDDTFRLDRTQYHITSDILRRITINYFGYDVILCKNICDIFNNKTIHKARQNDLIEHYMNDNPIPIEKLVEDCELAVEYLKYIHDHEKDKNIQATYHQQILTAKHSLEVIDGLPDIETKKEELFNGCHDILAIYLDFNHSNKTSLFDNQFFLEYCHENEKKTNNYIKKLNILPVNILTRSSEYILEIIKYIEQIIDKGYAYVLDSSVYFDTLEFNKKYSYPKFEVNQTDDIATLIEGVQALTTSENSNKQKKNQCDFILWQKSEQGEPGSSFDIYTYGIDIKFAHHQNEIAQFKAYYDSDAWINYFIYIGPLITDESKKSSTLNNDVKFFEAFDKLTPNEIRLIFLLNSCLSPLDGNPSQIINEAIEFEQMIDCFFGDIKQRTRRIKAENYVDPYTKFNQEDTELFEYFQTIKKLIHVALCDSIDTQTVMMHISNLISTSNESTKKPGINRNIRLLKSIEDFLTRLMNIFGLDMSCY